MVFQSGCDRCRTAAACTGWFPNSLASSSSSPKPSGNGQPIPAATARSRYSWTVPSPIPQLRAIWRCPNPNSNLNRRTSLTFRMDFLLAGTLSSLIDGVSMPGDCPASLHLLLFVCGKHSAPSRTPFRQATKNCSPSHRNRRSPSDRNAVRNHNGIVFGFTAESRSPSPGSPTDPGSRASSTRFWDAQSGRRPRHAKPCCPVKGPPASKTRRHLVLMNDSYSTNGNSVSPARFTDIHQLVSPLNRLVNGLLSGDKRCPN